MARAEYICYFFLHRLLLILWYKNRVSECHWRQKKHIFARNIFFSQDSPFKLYNSFIIRSVVEHRDCEHLTHLPLWATFQWLSLFSIIKFLFPSMIRTLRAVDQKHLESFEMWCWKRMEKISWTDHVRNEEVLLGVKEQRNILHEIRKRRTNCFGRILRRNCLLQRVIEGNIQGGIEVIGRQGRRRTKLLDDLK